MGCLCLYFSARSECWYYLFVLCSLCLLLPGSLHLSPLLLLLYAKGYLHLAKNWVEENELFFVVVSDIAASATGFSVG